eukprot:GFKZ01009595.1.p1 GENE.GFKZ01009595.1~~GFKZ01009595.1.p1  ORF type:complete len:277 (+),score=39.67 GFKZ01009595.1:104-934(+)
MSKLSGLTLDELLAVEYETKVPLRSPHERNLLQFSAFTNLEEKRHSNMGRFCRVRTKISGSNPPSRFTTLGSQGIYREASADSHKEEMRSQDENLGLRTEEWLREGRGAEGKGSRREGEERGMGRESGARGGSFVNGLRKRSVFWRRNKGGKGAGGGGRLELASRQKRKLGLSLGGGKGWKENDQEGQMEEGLSDVEYVLSDEDKRGGNGEDSASLSVSWGGRNGWGSDGVGILEKVGPRRSFSNRWGSFGAWESRGKKKGRGNGRTGVSARGKRK